MDTGTKVYRNYFGIKFGWQCDCQFGSLYPVLRKMMFPGDVFKIHSDLLIRYQPMLTPPMNDCVATVRFFFVPLRLIEENTELIITGSKDGHLYTDTLPEFPSVFHDLDVSVHNTVEKHSMLDVLYGIPAGLTLDTSGLLAKLDADKASPAQYFDKGYLRCWWDYYRDENLYNNHNEFESLWNAAKPNLHFTQPYSVTMKKDRITSSLPWQLKATAAPMIEITGSASFTPNYDNEWISPNAFTANAHITANTSSGPDSSPFVSVGTEPMPETQQGYFNDRMNDSLNQTQTASVSQLGFNWAQLRELGAQTRVFERLARCGSRYTEYLRANFGIAPADDTLQRAQYLGGFKTRIVTTEVVQTAGAGDNPVGTLRGHGITHGTSVMRPYMAKEIGIIFGLLDVKPETIYAQGVDRELTYRSRFDFLNPSFQHLSEQEVRKGEVFFGTDVDSNGDLVNGKTWGFQPYAQELRTGIKHVVGDMRDSLSYWNQALIMTNRPSLNIAFMNAKNHTASYNRPFAVSGSSAYPLIVDFGGVIEAYRPLVKNGTPGLADHN